MDLIHDSSSGFIKITIDSPRNIPIKETTVIAKSIRNDDSILSLFPNGCQLEVSTPGVGTDLVKKFQYKKNIGRKLFLKFHDIDYNIVSDTFLLIGVEEKSIVVKKSNKDHIINFKSIISAKIKVSFD